MIGKKCKISCSLIRKINYTTRKSVKKLYIRQLSEFYVFPILFRVFNVKKCRNDQINAN